MGSLTLLLFVVVTCTTYVTLAGRTGGGYQSDYKTEFIVKGLKKISREERENTNAGNRG